MGTLLIRRSGRVWQAALAGALLLSTAACGEAEGSEEITAEPQLYLYDGYDETVDPSVHVAEAVAQADGRRILLEVGGDWCVWCTILDNYLDDNDDVRAAFADSFMIVKVNYSTDHPNTEFLGQYPEAEGYPHFYVLDSDGSFLASQGTAELEEGRGYNRELMLDFADSWLKS